jgi:CBS domain-containing protein
LVSFPKIANTMAAETLALLPVVAREGYVVGVVTALDLVQWMARDGRGARSLP